MKTTRVNRYNCEYCNKRMYVSGAMKKHELHCTANPRRECRMCELADEAQLPIEVLIAVLPDSTGWAEKLEEDYQNYAVFADLANDGLSRLRTLTKCPACILSAIRQRGIAGHCNFDFKKEAEVVLDSWRQSELENNDTLW